MSTDIRIKKNLEVQDESSTITPDASKINFVGSGVSATASGSDVTVNISGTPIGGGASVSYYLNGSVNQGVFAGNTYYQMSKTALLVPNADFNIAVDGYVAQFITDVADPNQLVIPAGNWNFELFFSASSSGGTPAYYVELYKYDGASFSLIASNSTNPEGITNGTAIDSYFTALAVPQTTLLATDRLAVRIYVIHSGRTITLHTQDSHLCQIITTFSTGITALNGLTSQIQTFSTGTTGNNFNIVSAGSNHTFNLPSASATSRGALSNTDWSTFNSKQDAITLTTTGSSGASTLVGATLNIPVYANTNIYNTDGTLTGNRTVTMAGNTLNFSGGNVGVNIAPTVPLHVRGTAVPSVNEELLKLEVSDSNAYFSINNSSTVNGEFVPQFIGRQSASSVLPATIYGGIIDSTQDSGTEPVSIFRSFLSSLSAVTTRPVFQFKNWATNLMTVLANGNVGIGTITPTEKLEVSGKTKTTTFQMTTSPVNGYVLTSDASGNGTWAAPAGGLTYFTEAQSTAAPNATVPVDSLTATGAATNIDAAIVPKGTGAFMLDIPDNTTTGGNKRGAGAVDLCMSRIGADRVASGTNSFNVGASSQASGSSSAAINGIATGSDSLALQGGNASNLNTIAIGVGAIATGSGATALPGYAIGATSQASGTNSLSFGSATASGFRSVAIGTNTIANGSWSYVFGKNTTANSVDGRNVIGYTATDIGVFGDTQKSTFFLGLRTTGNTATTLTVGGGAASTTNQVILSNQSAYRFKGTIIGKQSGSTNVAAWDIDGLIVRGANAASTTLSLSNVTLVQNTPAWGTPTLAADTTNGGLQVQVTGAAATNIQWTAVIETTEVIYA